VNFISSPFLPSLQTEVPIESIPVSLGGQYAGWNTPFEFDTSENGLLAFPHQAYPFNASKPAATSLDASSSPAGEVAEEEKTGAA
jgi:hypothetical protein